MSPTVETVVAAGLVGTAVSLLLGSAPAPVGLPRSRGPARRALLGVTCLAAVPVLWWWLDASRFALVVVIGASGAAAGRLVLHRRETMAAERRSERVLALCEGLASDLSAGQPPLAGLSRAAEEWPDFGPVAAAGQLGADVPAALRELALRPGAAQLNTLAATWQVAHDTGAGLAGALAQAAESIRQQRRTARLVGSELAAARATARMLALLPVGVGLLGAGIGADPIGFLTGSVPGLVCLGAGLALSLAGLWWLERIADQVLAR